MADMMMFPNTVEEFMENYKITDTEHVYTNGTDLVPIFRMRQWFEHAADVAPVRHGKWIDTYGDSWVCSVCGAESYVDEDWRKTDDRAYKMNYCHYCGARMDGDTDG